MKKEIFQKHETTISILLIVIYILTNSFCMQNFGEMDYRSVIVNSTLLLAVILFIVKNKLGEYYGLTKLPKFKEFLYFIPLLILMSVNLWGGVHIKNTSSEIIFYILFMICVGFLEEIIFRGFLFKMMEKDNVNTAIIVSSLTFGIGHIINLFNGAALIPTLIQVCYAVAGGYLFVIIFQKGKSLWPCIIAHACINASSIFGIENIISTYIAPVFLILISVSYAMCLNKKIKN
ncbi:MAG: CPBP family intramembrane metalloprotease [Clostridia bacterium]|nr:CPBP family intramembrane metalloprotease [Clostridia bacterium]